MDIKKRPVIVECKFYDADMNNIEYCISNTIARMETDEAEKPLSTGIGKKMFNMKIKALKKLREKVRKM